MEEVLIKSMCQDALPMAFAFYALVKINGTLDSIGKSLDRLEKRIERLEALILKEVSK